MFPSVSFALWIPGGQESSSSEAFYREPLIRATSGGNRDFQLGRKNSSQQRWKLPTGTRALQRNGARVDAARKPLPLLVSGWARRSCLIHWGRCRPAGSPLHRPRTQGPSPPGTPAVPVGGEGTGKTSALQLLNPKYPLITSSWRNRSHPLKNTFQGEKTAGEA